MIFFAGLFFGFVVGFLCAAILASGGAPRGGYQPRRGSGHTPPHRNPPPRAP